jgi:hypothetical protein
MECRKGLCHSHERSVKFGISREGTKSVLERGYVHDKSFPSPPSANNTLLDLPSKSAYLHQGSKFYRCGFPTISAFGL